MTISGEITTLISALGEQPGTAAVEAAQALLGQVTEQRLTPKGGMVKKDWLTYEYRDEGTALSFGDDELCKIVVRVRPESGWAAYPRPEKLIDGVDLATTREELLTRLGAPKKTRPDSDLWQIGRRFLHVRYTPAAGTIGRISVMMRSNGQ
ncbi:hypothetical protein [Microbacterium sp.]|uniref:hypothetical protein n=1 Tax=Microbacterium sp. TaxID=51671 RepID=UPI0028120362|nr:hypothetical protein [Microbacterium sp.]